MRDRCSTPWAIHDNARQGGRSGDGRFPISFRHADRRRRVRFPFRPAEHQGLLRRTRRVRHQLGGIGQRAHRQADALHAYVAEAEAAGVRIFIGAAGLAAHLPGVLASLTAKPVIGVPLDGGALGGADALYSVVQMPPGCPLRRSRSGAGARNAAHLAARILAPSDEQVAQRVADVRVQQAAKAELRIDPRSG